VEQLQAPQGEARKDWVISEEGKTRIGNNRDHEESIYVFTTEQT
jgi:hypothetical protein